MLLPFCRFDIANPRRHFIIRAVTLQNGTVSVIIYLAALVLSLSNAAIEDKINLHDIKPMLWNNTAVSQNICQKLDCVAKYRNILSFRTDRPGQTVQTQISSLIRVYTVFSSFRIFWTHYS